MKNTAIEWAHHTVNFWWGCTFARLADGSIRQECVHCYALKLSRFFAAGKATWGELGLRWVRHEAARRELYKMDKAALKSGVRERVFINSMSDTFEYRRDLDEARAHLWGACQFVSNLDILILTKRPENVLRLVPAAWLENWPAHVWVGTTAGTRAAADEAIPSLLKIPAKVRFLSMEPLLEAVQFSDVTRRADCVSQLGKRALDGIHWVIVGGESGPKARPMRPEWARSLRDQCAAVGVPFFFKQWGEHAPTPDVPGCMYRPGKKAAGRLLDGVEHNEVPQS